MKNEKILKVEHLERFGKWGIIGKVTGKIYYISSKFDCSWWLSQKENKDYYEKIEKEVAELVKIMDCRIHEEEGKYSKNYRRTRGNDEYEKN